MQQCTWEPLAEAAGRGGGLSVHSCDDDAFIVACRFVEELYWVILPALVLVVDFQSIAAILASGTVRPFAYHAMTCGLSIALAQLGNTG